MAGIQLTGPRRSQILEQLLRDQRPRQPQTESMGQLFAELGTAYLNKKRADELAAQEKAQQDAIVRALNTGAPTAPSVMQMEQIAPDVAPLDPVAIPGRRAVRSEQEAAINTLPLDSRMMAREMQAADREANAPTQAQMEAIAFKRQKQLIDIESTKAVQRDALNNAATAVREEKKMEHDLTLFEREELMRENEQIRGIQAEFSLERLKNQFEGGIDGWTPTEQQAKGMSWYISSHAGNSIIEREMEKGYRPSIDSISVYAKAIDPDTGAATRIQLRRLLPQRALTFLDSAYMMVDPVVRKRTGAAVRTDEFITTFNSMIPMSDDESEITTKKFFRASELDGMRVIAGDIGAAKADQVIASRGLPEYIPYKGTEDEYVIDEATQKILDEYGE